ncbi:hypothetical protein DID78_03565 [Candidatus Marinamargulisbacteria bacterium SCGC AG-343-D04]|nr:hypothetical protein DID78_03565 [Candidatus Marinamargulisbacteria bacterium SCGC AG-343-D04]
MNLNKIRPCVRPKLWKHVLGFMINSDAISAYRIQRQLEKKFFLGKDITDIQNLDTLNKKEGFDIRVYKTVLTENENELIALSKQRIKTPYIQYVLNEISFEEWIKTNNVSDQWYRAKNEFRRSMNRLKKDQLDITVTSSRKAYLTASWYLHYLCHLENVKILENINNLLDILCDTSLLSRQTKRLKYYKVLSDYFMQFENLYKVSVPFYSSDDSSVLIDFFQRLKSKCSESIEKDLNYVDIDKVDTLFLDKFKDECLK